MYVPCFSSSWWNHCILIVDTHDGDPVTTKGGGFHLKGQDYYEMGKIIGSSQLPTVVIQEGGYKLDIVGEAATNFLLGLTEN